MKRFASFTLIVFAQFSYVQAQLELNASGNVGIGTTPSSSYKLKTNGSVFFDNGNVGIGTTPSSSHKLKTDGSVFFDNGNVGIGTGTPTNIGGFNKVLDVHGSNSALLTATTSDGITTSLMSSTYSDWGGVGTQSNHIFQIRANNIPKIVVKTNGEVNVYDYLRFGSFNNKITLSATGSYGSANGFDFNTSSSQLGIIMEQGYAESSGFYADGDFAVIWSPGDQERLLRVYDEDGMVEKWYLDANGIAHTSSDLSRKENIKEISSVASRLSDIRGVSYNYKAEDQSSTDNLGSNNSNIEPSEGEIDSTLVIKEGVNDTEKYQPSSDEYFGFIAQEVEPIFPELVGTDENGNKFISYMEFIPLLVEAIKEQQAEIESLQTQINSRNQASALKSATVNDTQPDENQLGIESELFQNAPNPFSDNTTIKYFLEDDIRSAKIYVYDMTGKQLRNFDLPSNGNGEIQISGGELDAGMYTYTMIADGVIIGSKQLILTK